MDNGETESRIGRTHPLAAVAFDHDQPTVDLAAPVHPGGVLLADETALGEAYSVQFGGIALQP